MSPLVLAFAIGSLSPPPAAISTAELDSARTGGAVLVDLRPPEVFATGHIPGSIRLSPLQMRTGLTRAKSVILIDEGLPGGAATTAAIQLEKGRAQLRVLAGGFRAWCASGQAVAGSCVDADRVPATAATGPRLIFWTADVQTAQLVAQGAHTVSSIEALRSAIIDVRVGYEGPIIIGDTDGRALEQLRGLGPNVWRLDGGLSGLRAARAPAALGAFPRLTVRSGPGAAAAAVKGGCGCRH